MSTLKERCHKFYQRQMRRAITRTGNPVDDLFEFVLAEKGRVTPTLEKAGAVIFYVSDKDTDALVEAFQAAYPNATVRTVK